MAEMLHQKQLKVVLNKRYYPEAQKKIVNIINSSAGYSRTI